MDTQDMGFMLGMGALAFIGLLYMFTDIDLPTIAEKQVHQERSEEQNNTTEQRNDTSPETDTPSEVQAVVEIARVRETRTMTTEEEERAHDRDRNFKGDEEREYVTLRAARDNTIPVNVTGWKLRNKFDTAEATIGQARVTTRPGRTTQSDIILSPGDEVHVMSGEPPSRWFSARLNICHGYFNHYFEDELVYSIRTHCPIITADVFPSYLQEDEFCMDSLDRQRQCQPAHDISSFAPDECRDILEDAFTYTSCVERSYQRDDFLLDVWRYYLDADDPLWNISDDGLILYNKKGELVDTRGIR